MCLRGDNMQTMKDSGIEWIGQIPSDWEIIKLKHIATIETGGTPPRNNSENYDESGIDWVKPNNITDAHTITDSKEKISERGLLNLPLIPAGGIAVNCIGTVGKCGLIKKPSVTNQQINSVVFNEDYDNRFGLYCTILAKQEYEANSNKVVVGILNKVQQSNIYYSKTTSKKMLAIADYLDKKCGEIDFVIEGKKKTIEKLRAYRQSLIFECVTKGLDKTAPMKDSGIEWIGNIPSHWGQCKLKYIASLMLCKDNSKNKDYLGLENVESNTAKYIASDAQLKESEGLIVSKNDVLFGKLRPYLGKVYLSDKNYICSSEFLVLKSIKLIPAMLKYFFLTANFINLVDSSTYGTKMPRASWEFIGNIELCLSPSFIEQQQIAGYLDKKCKMIDNIIESSEKIIEKLADYKNSLIYECVTGKREIAK